MHPFCLTLHKASLVELPDEAGVPAGQSGRALEYFVVLDKKFNVPLVVPQTFFCLLTDLPGKFFNRFLFDIDY